MKKLIIFAISFAGVFAQAQTSKSVCDAKSVHTTLQQRFNEIPLTNSYDRRHVVSGSFQKSVLRGQTTVVKAGFEDSKFTNNYLFDVEIFEFRADTFLDSLFMVVVVETTRCQVLDAIVLDSTDVLK